MAFFALSNRFAQRGRHFIGQTVINLSIVGDVADKREADDLDWEIRRRGLEHAIVRLGGANRAQVAEIMRNGADILVLPSEGETFGCVVVEALGAGLAVASTRSGGPDETLAGEPAARLSPVGDARAFADSILDLWNRRATPELAPDAVAARAAARFSYERIAAEVADRYRLVMAGEMVQP